MVEARFDQKDCDAKKDGLMAFLVIYEQSVMQGGVKSKLGGFDFSF